MGLRSHSNMPSNTHTLSTDSSMRRLLFVDNDDALAQSVMKQARGWSYPIDLAHNGRRALELAQRHEYAVVLTEGALPDMAGAALIGALAQNQPAPLFIVTTHESDFGRKLPLRICSNLLSLLSKPWDSEQLSLTLSMATELYRKRREQADTLVGTTVLLVEDRPGDALDVAECLSRVEGLTLLRAARLGEALGILHDDIHGQPIDIILTDLALPDACGVDSVLRLRASAPGPTIVVCTHLSDEWLAEQLMQLGAQDFLSKQTVTEPVLLRTLRFARERKRAEERLAQMAFFDPLTGLANRSKFEESAEHAVARARRRNTRLACMFIDLDGFKGVNDRLGHPAGDALLRDVATRLRQVFRNYDTIARLGGDEFAILLTDIENYGDVAQIAARLCDALAERAEFDDQELRVTASIGISMFPDAAESVSDLILRADQAMYDSKRAGKNRFSFWPSQAEAG
jgi:diguanylate cyclase (GGDEF)-like protein